MRKAIAAAAVLGVVMGGLGCAASGGKQSGPELSHEEKIAKQLATKKTPMAAMGWMIGDWEQADEKGQMQTVATYRATANETAICETLFAGAPFAMVTMYHMDGDELMMTHYCAAGNQPRLRAEPSGNPDVLTFAFDDATNFSKDDSYMGRLVITRIDADHVREEWTSYQNGKRSEGAVFELSRKK